MQQPVRSSDNLLLLDNTVLSNFALVRCTELVIGMEFICVTTQQAWREFWMGVAAQKLPSDAWAGLAVFDLTEVEREFWRNLPSLGAGEASCLAVAYHRQAILATDDAKARKIARQWNLKITGTIGILLAAVRQDRITLPEANRLLEQMMAAGFRSPVSDLADI